MPKKIRSKTRTENSAELDGSDAMLEIARLQEQVKLLTIEIQVLRSESGHEVSSSTPSHFGSKSAKRTGKGCSCKGNCSTKICGCVKRDKKCDHLCKCSNASCQNQGDQESDRDGDGDYDEHKVLRNKHLDTPDNVKAYGLPSFDSPKTLDFSSEENSAAVVPTKIKKTRAKSQEKEAVPRSGRLLKKSQIPTDTDTLTIQRSRSTSNGTRKTKKENQDEVHDLRKSASSESDLFTDDSLLNIADGGTIPLRRKKLKEYDESKGNSGVLDNETLDLYENDPHFDPTKPKKQLQRTPTRSGNESPSSTRSSNESPSSTRSSNESPNPSPINRVSDILLPPSVLESDEDDRPAPEELKEVDVDWNEHLAQRVPCDKCSRKFHPDRIKKHRAVCKGL